MLVGPDGRVHGRFGHNPSTLRSCMFDPNMQNLPRGGEWGSLVKQMFVAPAGWTFWERDFSAIEAVLVGYFAGSARYTRFAKLGVHDYVNSHLVGRPADLSLSDADLKGYFGELKKAFPRERDVAKRIVHLSNYKGTPRRMWMEYPETFSSIKEAARLQDFYYDLFPEIPTWHKSLCDNVDGTRRRDLLDGEVADPWTLGVAYVRNPFGYIHRFYSVYDWEKVGNEWFPSFGEDAKRLIAFLPQSTAAAIIKRAMRRLWGEFPWVGETLRLLIHDSLLGECREQDTEMCVRISREVMEEPIPELPLDPSWGMGECLTIGSECKVGTCWGSMEVVK